MISAEPARPVLMKSPSKRVSRWCAGSNVERPAVCSETSPSTKINEASPASSDPELPMARREKDSDSTARRNASSYFLFPNASCAPVSKSLACAALEPGREEDDEGEARDKRDSALAISLRAFSSGDLRVRTNR